MNNYKCTESEFLDLNKNKEIYSSNNLKLYDNCIIVDKNIYYIEKIKKIEIIKVLPTLGQIVVSIILFIIGVLTFPIYFIGTMFIIFAIGLSGIFANESKIIIKIDNDNNKEIYRDKTIQTVYVIKLIREVISNNKNKY